MNQVLKVLSEVGIQKIMFSSTASLYGNNCIDKPATEDTLLDPVNPYAETKLMGRTNDLLDGQSLRLEICHFPLL